MFFNRVPRRDYLSIAYSVHIFITVALGEHNASFRSLLKIFFEEQEPLFLTKEDEEEEEIVSSNLIMKSLFFFYSYLANVHSWLWT